ncbi:MAG TPA: GNAT family protein [Bryobacteraceae bacterium]|jgi:RimJ/RimL family protein N-acetyltransferase
MKRAERTTIEGRRVTVVPLDPEAHAEALYGPTHGPERDELWRYMSDGPFADQAAFEADLRVKAVSNDPLYFAIRDHGSGRDCGRAAYLRMEPAHGVIEVGAILYAPSFQRTAGATEAMYLMARHAFEELGCRRYEWKCNAENERSRRAAQRLGFTFEGIFRQHMMVKGRNRDTAWYSMLDSEWPARRASFEGWLEPSNFDEQGRQKAPLSAFS